MGQAVRKQEIKKRISTRHSKAAKARGKLGFDSAIRETAVEIKTAKTAN
jgi:hypothetical protein